MTRRFLWVAVFAVANTPAILAQPTDPAKPKFEVASIKECTGTEKPPPSISSPGRLSLSCWPLWRLIGDAYETFADGKVGPLKLLVPLPLDGTPAWVNSARYSIDAKTEVPVSGAMMRGPFMQTLLEDRFQVKVHRETKEMSGYVMTVAKGGLKMQRTVEGSCTQLDPTDLTQSLNGSKPMCMAPAITRKGPVMVYDVRGMILDVFCKLLHPNGRPVTNGTGLTGPFDIHFEWEPDPANAQAANDGMASDPSPNTSQTLAMRDQLGLQLTPGTGTREVLIIDRIARPSGN